MREPRAVWHGQPPLAPLTRSLQVGAADSAGTAVAALSSQLPTPDWAQFGAPEPRVRWPRQPVRTEPRCPGRRRSERHGRYVGTPAAGRPPMLIIL